MSRTCPYRCTSTTALVFEERQRSALSSDNNAVSASISAKTGVAPERMIATTVATAVIGVVTTSSPGPMSSERSAISIASVPFAAPTACETPHTRAHSHSKAWTSLPRMYQPEWSTRETAASIASRSAGGSAWKSLIRIISFPILLGVLAVEVHGLFQADRQGHPGRPPHLPLNQSEVAVIVSAIDGFPIR